MRNVWMCCYWIRFLTMCGSIEDFEILSGFDNVCTASWTHMRQKSWNLQLMFPLNQRCNILNLKKKTNYFFLKEVKHVRLLTLDADNERKAIEIGHRSDLSITKVALIDWFERSNSFDIPNFTLLVKRDFMHSLSQHMYTLEGFPPTKVYILQIFHLLNLSVIKLKIQSHVPLPMVTTDKKIHNTRNIP